MSQPARRRPPPAVRAAVIVFVVKYLLAPTAIGLSLTRLRSTPPSVVRWGPTGVGTAVTALPLLVVLGYMLWRGNNGSRILVLLKAVATLVIGIALFPPFPSWWVLLWLAEMALAAILAALLLLPPASRAWFTSKRSARDSTPNPKPHAEIST